MRVAWEEPVVLIRDEGRRFSVITTTEDAYEALISSWPISDGPAFLAALEICNGVSFGASHRNVAREAFINAAKEAGLTMQSISSFRSAH